MIKYFNDEIKDGCSFVDHTLFLPAVSVGNVGQLTADVVLANAGPSVPQKIGRLFHPGIEAVVGTDPCGANGDASNLVTSCEIFWLPEKKHVIAHFHSPITMRKRSEFVEYFCDWIHRQKFKQVVCFSSTFASDRNDQQLVGLPLRFITTTESDGTITNLLKKLEWEQLEKRQFPAPAILEKDQCLGNTGVWHLPGSGFTLQMYDACQTKLIPFVALIMFASEGDNTPEALTMFEAANKLFNFIPPVSENDNDDQPLPIKVPLTWSYFHGRSHPVELY